MRPAIPASPWMKVIAGLRSEICWRETAASDAVLAGLSLDAPPARWPDYFSWRLRDVREIILHVITETAVHAGHLDAARELLDGRTWLGPEGTRIPPG